MYWFQRLRDLITKSRECQLTTLAFSHLLAYVRLEKRNGFVEVLTVSMIEIGQRISDRRKRLDLTQSELARQLDVARETISNWERGTRQILADDIPTLAKALLETVERAEAIEGLRRGLEQMKRGEGQPAEEVFAHMRQKFGISHE